MAVIDLNRWHYTVHQVSGGMALNFNKATPADLKEWIRMLRAIADEMEAAAKATGGEEIEVVEFP